MTSQYFNVYLGSDLKSEWLSYCERKNIKPGPFIREMIEKEMKESSLEDVSTHIDLEKTEEAKKKRVEIRLSVDQFEAIIKLLNPHSETIQTWIIEAIRARIKEDAHISHSDLHSLTESNAHLRAVGVNLNQIARVLNTHENAQVTPDQMKKVTDYLYAHIDQVNSFVRERIQKRGAR